MRHMGALTPLMTVAVLAAWLLGAEAARTAHSFGSVTLSNTKLPVDTAGSPLITGEASVLKAPDGYYYFFFNNWGECYCGTQYPWLESCCASKTW